MSNETDDNLDIEIDDEINDAGVPENGGEVTPEAGKESGTAPAEAASQAAAARTLEDAERELAAERAERAAAERRAQEAEERGAGYQTAAQKAQGAALDRAIEVANGKLDAVENDLTQAYSDGDYAKIAKLQRQMGAMQGELQDLQRGKRQLEQQAPRQQQKTPPADAFEAHIAKMSEPTKAWLRKNRDAISNPVKHNRTIAAHHTALADGLQPDTPEYFAAIEKLVYPERSGAPAAKAAPRSAPAPAAPVNGRVDGGQVRVASDGKRVFNMTPKMRQMADDLGITYAEYAKGYLAGLKDGSQQPIH